MITRACRRCPNHVKLLHGTSISRANSQVALKPQKPYYVTSPIFYVNAVPHIGHLYSMVVADILARWEFLRNPFRDILYTTGTDEHGLKIQQAAKSQQMLPSELSDVTSQRFKDLTSATKLISTTFIRTTEQRHAKAVEDIWRRLVERGYIYKGVHSGWYAVSDEAFYTSTQVEQVTNPATGAVTHVAKETGKEVVWTEEENYKFRLSEFRSSLKKWIEATSPITPRKRQDEILAYLSDDASLQDLSVSRLSSRVEWGIPVPDDPSHTIYVWLDALTSYMTAVGYPWDNAATTKVSGWPADVHVVGKDILRFHAIYFPSFLMALDIPLPRGILCHAHWTMGRQKMSKSVGNVVDPFVILDKYGTDSVRWYLAKVGGHWTDDVDWSLDQLEVTHDRDLRGLGNLYRRLHAASLCDDIRSALPSLSSPDPLEQELVDSLMSIPGEVTEAMKSLSISRAIEAIVARLDLTNRYFTQREPWKEKDAHQRGATVALARESLRICTILLQPFLPTKAPTILDWLDVPVTNRSLIWASYGAVQSVGGRVATPDQRLFEPFR